MRIVSRHSVTVISMALFVTAIGAAQKPGAPSFEVAAIHENTEARFDGRISMDTPGRVVVDNIALGNSIEYAYGKRPDEVAGAPGWTRTTRFNITASYGGAKATEPEVQLMLQKLLVDRFALVSHHENRNIQRYTLVLARSDGKLGSRLVPTEDIHCDQWLAAGHSQIGAGGPSPVYPGGTRPQCMTAGTQRYIVGGTQTIAKLVTALQGILRAPVIDKTGLSGTFNFDLEFTPPNVLASTTDGVSIFAGIQEQLGLKLQSEQGPVDFVVIDAVQRPTPN